MLFKTNKVKVSFRVVYDWLKWGSCHRSQILPHTSTSQHVPQKSKQKSHILILERIQMCHFIGH